MTTESSRVLMIFSAGKNITGFPFISSCSRELGGGLILREHSILDANLYPSCGSVDYAQVIRIGRSSHDRTQGEIVVGDPRGNIICTVVFDDVYTTAVRVVGAAYGASGERCGCIVCSRDILPILRADYYPVSGSLIFTPSVFRPRQLANSYGRLKDADGTIISSVLFQDRGTDDYRGFHTIDGEVSLYSTDVDDTIINEPVTTISVNGITSADNVHHLRITPTPGSPIRIETKANELILGVGCDL